MAGVTDQEHMAAARDVPTRAGVDPYNKLIDRKPEDNVIAVAKGS